MSEIADRYNRLAAAFTGTADAVPADAWGRPSPCEGWSARDVVRHVAATEYEFLYRHGLTSDTTLPDDPLHAWSQVRAMVQGVSRNPAVAARAFDGFFGPTTVEATVDRFYAMDLMLHRWDLARAAGLAEHDVMAPEEVIRLLVDAQSFGDAARQPGVFGPEVPVSPDAPAQDRLLAFTGRRP